MYKSLLLSLLFCIFYLPVHAAAPDNVVVVDAFKGGLDEEDIDRCTTEVIGYCESSESFKSYLDCAKKHMETLPYCKQNLALMNAKDGVFKTIKRHGSVYLVNADVMGADHSEDYYMIGKQGDLVTLSSLLNIQHLPNYTEVEKKYPKVSLWPTAYALPKVEVTDNGNVRFVFQQLLLNGCFACEQVGIVRIAYDFTPDGRYKGAKALELIVNLTGHTVSS